MYINVMDIDLFTDSVSSTSHKEPEFGLPVCEPACPKAVGQPTPQLGFLGTV